MSGNSQKDYSCSGSWDGEYCGAASVNYGSSGSSGSSNNSILDTLIGDYGISDTLGQSSLDSGDETTNNPNIVTPYTEDSGSYLNNMLLINQDTSSTLNDANIQYNYYYNQDIDPNVYYPYDTTETPVKKPTNKYPFFKNRYDRPLDFNGTSHTYMRPKNWRYPKKKAPKCKTEGPTNEPAHLDRSFIPLDNWDSHIGTILPKFTYEEH